MADKEKKVPGVRVYAKTDSFRRAGHTFTREATDIALSQLSKEQIKALKSEPMLVVVDAEVTEPAEAI